MKNTKNNYSIFQNSYHLREIKDTESLADSIIFEINEFWKNSSKEQREEIKINMKLIKRYFSESPSRIRLAKNNFKQECRIKSPLIHKASESFKEKHGSYYGQGFICFVIDRFVDDNEKEILHDYKYEREYDNLVGEFFSKHIAWSLLRGKKISQIIPNNRNSCHLSWKFIKHYLKFFRDQICSSEKLFVFVRKDLSKTQQAIQAGHAVAEWCQQNGDCWQNGKLIYCQVDNLKELRNIFGRLKKDEQNVVAFHEPSRYNEMTAISVFTKDSNLFKEAVLMKL